MVMYAISVEPPSTGCTGEAMSDDEDTCMSWVGGVVSLQPSSRGVDPAAAIEKIRAIQLLVLRRIGHLHPRVYTDPDGTRSTRVDYGA
jgi:hypothetical protein